MASATASALATTSIIFCAIVAGGCMPASTLWASLITPKTSDSDLRSFSVWSRASAAATSAGRVGTMACSASAAAMSCSMIFSWSCAALASSLKRSTDVWACASDARARSKPKAVPRLAVPPGKGLRGQLCVSAALELVEELGLDVGGHAGALPVLHHVLGG
jgi:hypothetical protein